MRVAFALSLVGFAACGGDKVHHLDDAGMAGSDAAIPADAAEDAPIDAPPPDAFRVVHDLKGELGYVDANDKPAALVFFNQSRPALCKIAPAGVILSTNYTACPDADADGNVTVPVVATPGTTDGSYEADVLAMDAQGNNVAYATTFYIHRSLDKAAACPNDAAKWPTDKQFFDEAVKTFTAKVTQPPAWMNSAGTGSLPHDKPFALTAADLAGPFYKIHFDNVTLGTYRRLAIDNDHTKPSTTVLGVSPSFDVPIWSLRHHFALSSDKGLIVIYRQYESRSGVRRGQPNLCTIPTKFGFGPARQEFNCDAVVLNSAGEGFCMAVDDTGAPKQVVFARQMVQKLMAQSVGDDFPRAESDTMWGPKTFSPQIPGDPQFDDSQIETGTPGHGGSRAVILRP